jgi:dienelactone hydrolase
LILAGLVWAVVLTPAALAADLYKAAAGPYTVGVKDIVLKDAARPREVPLRIAYPDGAGSFPLVVLSHGGGSSKDGYVRVADHWASHGYVVVAPTHEDSVALGFNVRNASGPRMAEITASRMADLAFVAGAIDTIEAEIPALKTRIDRARMAAAGHSMGGGTALAAVGLKLKHKRSGAIVGMDNPGYSALVLLSEAGRNPMMPDEPWRHVDVPVLIMTGTNDFGGMSDGSKSPFGYDAVPSPDATAAKHYLWIEGVDHYMGGLWCCEGSKGLPDHGALAIFNSVSTAFLDAVLRNDPAARAFLDTADLRILTAGRAFLSRK